jgi:regulatory protein
LSRREHSEFELRKKLLAKGAAADAVDAMIGDLKRNNALSDDRYTEAYVRSRIERGDGPLKIRHELSRRGVSGVLIDRHMDHGDEFWERVLRKVCSRKFGVEAPGDYKEWARQARFLQIRGFAPEQIRKVVLYQEVV